MSYVHMICIFLCKFAGVFFESASITLLQTYKKSFVSLAISGKPCPGGLILVLLWAACFHLSAQKQVAAEFALGGGFPELLHTGARFKIAEQSQLGLFFGSMPAANGVPVRLELDWQYHLWGENPKLLFRKWYVRTGIMYADNPNDDNTITYLTLFAGPGRQWVTDFNLGLQIDLALHAQMFHRARYTYSTEPLRKELVPGIRLQVFYRSVQYKAKPVGR